MDKLLLLLLVFRLLRIVAPFLIGIIGALWVIGYVHPIGIPSSWLFLMFVMAAGIFISELKAVFGSSDHSSHRRGNRRGDEM